MRVLVADDDDVCRLSLEAMILALGHECLTAADGRSAWRILENEQVDVLITDREMPFVDGLELCQFVRTQLTSRHIYVILATGFGAPDEAREGMTAGADDYLVKPIHLDSVELRLIAAARVNTLHQTLRAANQELRTVARRDALTGLGNRRCLAEDLSVMAQRLTRYGHRFAIALLDIDHFKSYNDLYGHQQGDEALKAVSQVLRSTSRVADDCYRYGGEEFLIVFAEQTAHGALAGLARIEAGITELAIPHERGAKGILTLSAGVAEMNTEHPDATDVVRAADIALYEAKRLGRNRVELAAWIPAARQKPSPQPLPVQLPGTG